MLCKHANANLLQICLCKQLLRSNLNSRELNSRELFRFRDHNLAPWGAF